MQSDRIDTNKNEGGKYMEERIVKPFTMWRHFKGGKSFVITVAQHSETGEKLVIYRFEEIIE